MNKCKFCDHYGCSERKEGVCKKYLFWIDEELPSCEGFSVKICTKYAVGLLLLTVGFIAFLMMI